MDDLNDIKKLISSIIISCPQQMTIQQLNRDFADQIGHGIPYKPFGFRSLEECLRSMEDILMVRGTGMHAEVIAHISNKTAHIDKLIANQKSKPSRRSFGNRPKRTRTRPPPLLSNRQLANIRFNTNPRNSILPLEKVAPLSPPYINKLASNDNLEYSANAPPTSKASALDYSDTKEDLIFKPALVSDKIENHKVHNTYFQERTESCSNQLVLKNEFNVDKESNCYISTDNDDDLNNFIYWAIPRTSACSPSNRAQNDEDTDIYLSDEEEPINTRVPVKVQTNLALLIDNYDDGIWCTKIPDVYRKKFKKELDYEAYGYKSLIQMCMDLKNIFFWFRPDKGDFKLYDRKKPPPKDLDKHFKQSDYVKILTYLNSQPSNEPALNDVEELVNLEVDDHYPENVVQLGEEIPRQFISEHQAEEFIDVCVGEVYDPSKFWIMLMDYTPLLDKLMDDMQDFYRNCPELKIPPNMIRMGLYCAAVYNNEYHRAIIVRFLPKTKDRVKVFYVDYGTASITLTANLHFLHKRFFDLPQQAIRARLARIYPPKTNTTWCSESSARFLEMVKMKTLVADIYNIDFTQQIVEIFLADTSGPEDIYINDALVYNGYAIFTHEEQEQGPVDPCFIPRVKYLHLIPTFDEMEQGEVPNATEMLRLEKLGMSLEQILSHYFTQTNMPYIQNTDSEKKHSEKTKNEKKSLVALRRSQLQSLTKNEQLPSNNEIHLTNNSSVSSGLHSPSVEFGDSDLPSPDVVIAKPAIRPPPGFESIHEQKIKITTGKMSGGGLINTVVAQSTNIDTNNTQNILNYIFQNQNHNIQNAASSGITQSSHAPQNVINQLMLLAANQTQLMQDQHTYSQHQTYLPYPNHNLYNTSIPKEQFSYSNPPSINNPQASYYNQTTTTPLRLHMQESIKDLLLAENKITLNRFLFIIKKRLLMPGVHQGLFNLIPDIINKSIVYPQHTLNNIYKDALCFLSDDDIIDLITEAQQYTLFNQSNSAATQTQSMYSENINGVQEQLQQLNLNSLDAKMTSNSVSKSTDWTNKFNDEMIEENKLVFEIDFYNNKLHIINLENMAYVMVTEILQIVDQKMPIERVRKCIVMTDPLISVRDIRLQDNVILEKELSRYMYINPNTVLHVVPITFVPKLIIIIANRRDIASSFDDLLRKLNYTSNTILIS